ncbi:AMP-binding protein [Nocardia macrotermitis]|uniref:Acetyl-coenzyme A synthetase n=1 Tax=Nocardia macrotermitis TaxID=2585198 RepID=A0A7K0CZQ9_9NOCA|nr:AMP-binding protein [Nocardia macrotermitis]MQY18976.1 Acetyl-coenzyme A synthetase [Nocardia macrotermitis]
MNPTVERRVQEILDVYSAPDATVAWLLCDRHLADQVALTVVGDDLSPVRYTYADLAESSRRVAQVLIESGVRRGDRVAAIMGKSVDLVSVLLGIWRIGAVYVPLFTAFAEEAIRSRLADAGVVLVVADEDQLHKVPTGKWHIIASDPSAGDGLRARMNAVVPYSGESVAVGGDGPLVHMFTSGTTGKPKGVVHPVGYIAGWHGYQEFALGVQPDSTFWCGADPGWAYGLYAAIVAPLATGVPTILLRGGFSAASTWAVMADLRVTDYTAAPTVYRSLRASETPVPGNLALRRLSSAGEPLTPEVGEWSIDVLGLPVHDHYGQTELGMTIGFPHHPELRKPVVANAMGVALPGWRMTVLRRDEDIAADAGDIGRLAVVLADSPFMTFSGYAGTDAAAARFVGNGGERYFVTGDTASLGADGVIRFSSRDDDVIIMAGYRIGPFDVESTLLRHPAVVEAAVIAAPDPVRGEAVEAFVVLVPGTTGDAELVSALQRWVKDNYAAHAYPRRIHFVATLPKTPSGKIQRAELRRQRRKALPLGEGAS